jgi:NADH-quinone oxidoreductase subunit D
MATDFTFPDSAAKTAAANPPAEFETEKMSLSMGPSHPSTHGVLRLQMELDGVICTAATRRSRRT